MSDAVSADFEAWLVQEGYAESLRRRDLRLLPGLRERLAAGQPVPAWLAPTLRRWDRYHEARGLARASTLVRGLEGLARETAHAKVGGRERRRPRRKHPHEALTDAEWATLWTAVRADEHPASRVLEVQMASGLRVGDVLGIGREALRRGVEHGIVRLVTKGGVERLLYTDPAPVSWRGLHELFAGLGVTEATNVASAICGDSDPGTTGCAYYAVRRRLITIAKRAGLEGRVHTHRLRRTVAVQALRHTGDLVAVQQLLGHASIQSTSRYVDEAQPARVAQLQRELGEKFRPSK